MGEAGELGGALLGRLQAPEVSRLAFPPSAGRIQMWDGSAASVARKSLSPTSKAS